MTGILFYCLNHLIMNVLNRIHVPFTLFLLLFLSLFSAHAQIDPFAYPEAGMPQYTGFSFQSTYVTMPDGTRIAADIYLPTGGPPASSFPVIFQFTAYNRSVLIPRFGPAKQVAARVLGFGKGPVFDMTEIEKNAGFLLTYGYALVVADLRGTGASFGSQLPLMPKMGEDGKHMVDWIADQPWCDGKVGMMGASYLGWIQYMTAANQPEALRCIFPEVIGFEMYTAGFRPGGILAKRWITSFDKALRHLNRGWYNLSIGAVPALPVLDEDGDGDITDEWPVMDSLSQANRVMPRFRDGNPRPENAYFAAMLEHLDNVPVRELAKDSFRYYNAPGPGGYDSIGFHAVSPASYLPAIQASRIPVYSAGGWFDGFCKGSLQYFASLGSDYPARLWMTPRFHYPEVIRPYAKEFNYEGDYIRQLGWEQLRFFNKYLKGLDHGWDQRPPVLLFVMNEGWRFEQSWPLEREVQTSFFFRPDGSMATEPSSSGSDEYTVNFDHASNYGRHGRNRWLMTSTGPGTVMERTQLDELCLFYQTEPLETSLELTGHPVVHVWLSANQPNGDLFVYLEDVAPDGTATYISEGQLRAGFRRMREDDDIANGAYDVLPELPWHGYRDEDWLEEALGSTPVELTMDLMPVSWVIRKEHRIRVSLAGADKGNFELNPVICPGGTVDSCANTVYQVHRGDVFPSRIDLPVIPR